MASTKLRLQLTRSLNKRSKNHKANALGLGLKRMGKSVEVLDTPENWGMIKKISYLLKVEQVQ